jgi:hypothetical protein
MPKKGRPRLVSGQASATKLFVDDLREVIKLSRENEHGTVSDSIRDLVHEALVSRRDRAMGQEAAEAPLRGIQRGELFAEIRPIEKDIREIKEQFGKLTMIHSLLIETLGFTMASDMKSHILLQNFLLGRGFSEEAVKKMTTDNDEKSRRNTERIITRLQSQSGKA